MPVFKPKQSIPFAALEQVNEELDRLERIGVLQKVNRLKWAVPVVYV